MRATEFINEGLSSKLYHYTDIPRALSIMKDGEFKLASVVGSSHENTINPTKYPYFLSTTRTKHGGYHDPYNQGVMFNLNGDYYKQNYKGMPVDYWGDKHLQHNYGRKHEAEDRIVSKSPSIPVDGVSEIHIFLSEKLEKDSKLPQYARNLMILAKQRGIKCFIYNDKSAWMNQQTSASVGIKQHPSLQGKNIPAYHRHNKYGDPVDRWLELITKNSTISLSPRASDQLRNMLYYYQPGSTMNADIDFSNARKPSSNGYGNLVKIIKYMQQQGYTSVADLVSHLHNKWRNIKDNEQNQGI